MHAADVCKGKENMEASKTKIKIGIYAMGVLMMGIVGVSGALTVIGEHFPSASQSAIQSIISVPCLAVLPATILSGKLMDIMAKKTLGIAGMLLFIVGGAAPAFLGSLTIILIFRAFFGLGVGVIQSVTSALVAENLEGAERDAVQGTMTSAQMLGCALMVFAGGWLGDRAWDASFHVHWIAVISLLVALLCLPLVRPAGPSAKSKTTLTKGSWSWALITFFLFIGVQVYTVYIAYLLSEKGIGSAAQSGATVAVACIGGFVMGILYGRLAGRTKNLTFAVGLLLMALSYVVIAFAGSMTVIYAGGLIYGVSMSICMPAVFLNTAASVDAASAAMALSVTMCAQNLGQFVCPYVLNFITGVNAGANPNETTYLLAAALLGVMGVLAAIWGKRKDKRK